jgi:hypothetical protein
MSTEQTKLTEEEIDTVFVALLAVNARQADIQVVGLLGGTPEVLGEYIWDHWLAEPEDPSRETVIGYVESTLAGHPPSDR